MLWSLLKSSLAEVYRRCPECDALDPVFRNKDGRTASLRTDSSQSYNPTLAAFLNTQPIPASPAASPHNTAPVGRRAHRLSTSPSPTASELEDREEEMIDVEARMQTPALNVSALGELNTLSISDRLQNNYVEDASNADVSVSMSASDFVGSEQAWTEKKEADMKERARYREELLQVKKRKAETASFGERMRAADMLRKDDPSLSWAEALRKAAELMDSI